ncbi:AsmA family protein [Emcibacter sp. SYSU 3D8]|uniref:AsmA family protein n=1 Tax=Emcibacter sp. SYSU 3D8 TaxID=3133969 RepID=UPI0031FF3EB4
MLKKVLIVIAVVWGVVAAGLIVVPRLPSAIDYRSALIAQIEARTGRQAFIDGDVTMHLFPSPRITADEVRVANIDGAPSADVIRVRRAVFKVDRGSLLSRKLRVTGIELNQPKIYLDVLADGRRSWQFTPVKKPGKNRKVLFDAFTAKEATILYRKGDAQMMFNGDLSYDGTGDRPVLGASLVAGKIDLDPFLGPRDSGPEKARQGGKRWSQAPIDISALRGADGRIDIRADEIRYRRYTFAKPSLSAVLDNGQLRIDKAGAGLFGGAATVQGSVDARDIPALRLDVTLQDASVDQALSEWADTPFASGKFAMTANLSAAGGSQDAMVRSLSGTVLLEANDGVLRGFDAAQLNSELALLTRYSDFIDLADTALAGGQTKYETLGGTLAIRDGVANVQKFDARLDGSSARVTGSVDLPRWSVDLDLSLKLTGAQHAKTPPVGMRLHGPLDSPQQKNQLTAMGKFVGKQFVKTVIRDVLGDDEPRHDELAPGERRQKTKRVVNRLLDKLDKRRGRERPPYRLERNPRDRDARLYDAPAYRDDAPEYDGPSDDRYAGEDFYPDDPYPDDRGYDDPPDRGYSAGRGDAPAPRDERYYYPDERY